MNQFTLIVYTIIWLAFPICGLLGWCFYIKARHEERKLWIARGKDPDSIYENKRERSFPWLKLGMVAVSLGVGVLIYAILINLHSAGKSWLLFPALLFICGGLGLVAAHYLGNSKKSR